MLVGFLLTLVDGAAIGPLFHKFKADRKGVMLQCLHPADPVFFFAPLIIAIFAFNVFRIADHLASLAQWQAKWMPFMPTFDAMFNPSVYRVVYTSGAALAFIIELVRSWRCPP